MNAADALAKQEQHACGCGAGNADQESRPEALHMECQRHNAFARRNADSRLTAVDPIDGCRLSVYGSGEAFIISSGEYKRLW